MLLGEEKTIRRAKHDGQQRKRERKAVIIRRGWADETLESRFKVVTVVKKKDDIKAVLFSLITDYITPQEL